MNFKSKIQMKKFSFEDGSLVVFVFKNLIGWNTELNLCNYLVELVVFWDSKCILGFKMYFKIQNVFWDPKCISEFKMYFEIQNVLWGSKCILIFKMYFEIEIRIEYNWKKNFISQKHIPKSWNASYWNCNEKKIHWVGCSSSKDYCTPFSSIWAASLLVPLPDVFMSLSRLLRATSLRHNRVL